MLSTVLIVILVGLSIWIYLGGPMPNILSSQSRERAIVSAWLLLSRHVQDDDVREKINELLPLLLRQRKP